MKTKDLSDLASTLEEQGWRVRITNGGHAYTVYPPNSERPITFSTMTDSSDLKRLRTQFARYGIDFDNPIPRKESPVPRSPAKSVTRVGVTKTTPQKARNSVAARTEPRPSKPVADNWREASHYPLTEHLLERMQERNIGVYEVYSVIAAPDTVRSERGGGGKVYQRGDLRVAVAEDDTIKTAVDMDEDLRGLVPRKVQVPSPRQLNGGTSGRQKGTVGDAYDMAWLLVPHETPETIEMMVTPAIAEKLLALNVHNRPLRRVDVERWKSIIEEGGWLMTHQGVAIDTQARLQDGQHRLTAISEGNIAVRMLISVGMPPEAFDVIDTGRGRSYADVLSMRGVPKAGHVGAMLRLVWAYDHGVADKGGLKVPNAHVVTLLEENVGAVSEAMHMASQVRSQCQVRLSAAAAAIYLIRRSYTGKLWDEFFDGLINGVSHSRIIQAGNPAKQDPRNALTRLMLNWAREPGSRRAVEVMAVFLKAWMAYCLDRPVVNLVFRSDEQMPITFVPPGS